MLDTHGMPCIIDFCNAICAEHTIVASVLPWAAPAAAPAPAVAAAPAVGPAAGGGMRPIMVNVSRGGVAASTAVLNRGNGAGLISINRMAGSAAMAPAHNIRRCIF